MRQLPEDNEDTRRRFARAMLLGHSSMNDDDADLEIEEQKTIDFFDQWVTIYHPVVKRANTHMCLFAWSGVYERI
jgi:hypothetical protein